jgi:3-oxoacyl-[acyl-carrier protein] reductase
MEKELADRTALVTGGGRGIGRATCVRLAKAGARVAINYAANDEAAQETRRLVEAKGVGCTLIKADVSDPEAVRRMVEQASGALGPIDLLVHSAGIPEVGTHEEIDYPTWRRVMAVNLDGTFLTVMAVKDGMIERRYGRIVCFASIAGLRPRPTMLAYGTSKAGVIAFARSCSEALAPHIRINCIAPGLIDTDMPASSLSDAARQRMIDATPLKRIGQAEEMAELALFLLSERSSFITGQVISADGGRVTLP